jgi:two-component system, cell cycle response regulator DivK
MGQLPKEKPKLLIVEDDYENQKFLALFLGRYFEVDSCDSADSFYDLSGKKKYDLFLMDISIKGNKNGLELTREIKLNPSTALIPVVCYTAHAFQHDRLNALDAGCDEYISKPSNIYSLLKTLLSQLEKKSRMIANASLSPGFAAA